MNLEQLTEALSKKNETNNSSAIYGCIIHEIEAAICIHADTIQELFGIDAKKYAICKALDYGRYRCKNRMTKDIVKSLPGILEGFDIAKNTNCIEPKYLDQSRLSGRMGISKYKVAKRAIFGYGLRKLAPKFRTVEFGLKHYQITALTGEFDNYEFKQEIIDMYKNYDFTFLVYQPEIKKRLTWQISRPITMPKPATTNFKITDILNPDYHNYLRG